MSTKLTAIISIIVIVVIGLIIAPILTQAEIRKYKALLYFLKIPKEQFATLIKNCEYCLNMNDETRYLQIMKDYESFLGIKLINQQVDQLRQAKSRQSNLDAQNSRSGGGGTYGLSSGMRSSDFQSTGNSDRLGSIANSRVSKQNTGRRGEENPNDEIANNPLDIMGSAMESVASTKQSVFVKDRDREVEQQLQQQIREE